MNRKETLLMFWLYVFNEQMSDRDDEWKELDQSEAENNALFRHWLSMWHEDSRGKLLAMMN